MIVFPMAGFSSRFLAAGYTVPKFMLEVAGRPCFDLAVAGFLGLDAEMIFVMRRSPGLREFVEQRTRALGIRQPIFVELAGATSGQAETVERGLDGVNATDDSALTIFNIDTFRRAVRLPDFAAKCDGYLEVFHGSGANWSYVESDCTERQGVRRTAEKEVISDLCCTGLYHFGSVEGFRYALRSERKANTTGKELYVAPLYNRLIGRGADIRYDLISRDEVCFCGTPSEYEELIDHPDRLESFLADRRT